MSKEFKPYVPVESQMREFSFKAIFLGIIMAVVLGAANVYLGLKAGMTVAATFPAAVIAMAVLRFFKGTILEENLARTTGAVGEALAAGAIFTIPAFVMSGVWKKFNYMTPTILMLVGGILGVLFVIILRKTLIEDETLPYPESKACGEIVKSGQKGATGAGLVFGTMGLAALIELFKNEKGFTFIRDVFRGFLKLGKSKVNILDSDSKLVGAFDKEGGALLQSPAASPAFLGVGYIIGFRLAAITFSGGVFGWLFLMPAVLFVMSGDLSSLVSGDHSWSDIANYAYNSTVKPIAVGGMLVGAFYTLFRMRKNLIGGLSKGFKDITKAGKSDEEVARIDKDLPFGMVILAILIVVVAMIVIFQQVIKTPETSGWGGAVGSAIVMALAGFLFAAVAGYLVGIIGSSSNPISGLTLTTLLIAALLMVIIGLRGDPGIIATLAVATVVCCVAGVAGDMMQDWKVGHILGGTPWRMQIGGMIGVVAAALVLILPIMLLDKVPGKPDAHAIGATEDLPAPQAGLMSMMAKGIVGGEMAWPLVIAGMLFCVALILIKSPSPMLIAVGMYLPFQTTFAIFIGGVIRYFVDKKAVQIGETRADEQKLEGEQKTKFLDKIRGKVENTGLLLASGLVAGEALMGILLAVTVVLEWNLNEAIKNLTNGDPIVSNGPIGVILYFAVFAILAYLMIRIPIKKLLENKEE
ncbi:MAG: oligopeptide transporter, OPT family [Candidatus Aminicenantes bacterium]|nr:oligopeptide transporter, OPT family [Candidatus Aminicenantes bacterium]NIM80004.1 oligopeptide transporter, OPT family [Candidatus Aminicenantes bacterium]NIN19358.1 oligopeptide transporter, OPT family [Candidatus Aminicenantes bacterium]NIN43257.1 oligopeptide transporter, OPT family [Candidatus Aminicenantes bacterium]NIN85999.1 oligopeptide transporter, OPT family [Candidatus Aminicenantes bacterium]